MILLRKGETALIKAVRLGENSIVNMLINAGAKADLQDKYSFHLEKVLIGWNLRAGEDAASFAVKYGNNEIQNLLKGKLSGKTPVSWNVHIFWSKSSYQTDATKNF